jgi:chitinase
MLDKAYANYTDINNGYSDKFDAYVRYVKEVIPSALDKFMLSDAGGNGLQCK